MKKKGRRVTSLGSGACCLSFALLVVLLWLMGCTRDPAVFKRKYLESGNRYFNEKRYGEAAIQYKNALQVDPRFGEAYYRLGLNLFQQGQWSPAAESFSRAVEFSPGNLDARLRLGDILLAAGRYDEARAQADEVLKRGPENANVHLLLGQIQLQQKKYPQAEAEFEQSRQLALQDPVPYGNLALAELLNWEFDTAEKNFQKALELSPHDPQYVINLANFYRSRQQAERAEKALRQAMMQNPNAIELPLAVADLYTYQGRAADAKRLLDRVERDTQQYADGRRKVADFYFQHNDASSALDRYLALVQKNSSDVALVKSIVGCYLQLGRWPDAEQWIDKQDKKNKNPEFRLLRARAYVGEYRLREAISVFQSLVQEDAGNVPARFYLAHAELQKGDSEAAKAALIEAVRLRPGYIPALLGLADISLQQGDSTVALQYATQIISQSYWVVEAHLIAGNAYALRNDLTPALKEFQIAAALNPRNPAAQERLGRVLSAQGKYRDAEKAYEEALNADPGYAQALSGLADNFLKQGQADRARARLEQQTKSQPNAYQLQLVRGEFCMRRSDWACSEQSFRRALELNPYDVTAYLSLARVYAATNRTDEVAERYEQARQKFPDFLPTYIQLGLVYEARGDFERAKQVYQDALHIDQNYAPAQNNLAWLYCEHGGPLGEALELAQRAKEQQPDDPHVNDTLAWIYYKKGLYPSAVGLLESAAAKEPKDPDYQFHLGMVYLAQGKQQQGRRTLQAALRLGLSPEDANAAKEALQKAGS